MRKWILLLFGIALCAALINSWEVWNLRDKIKLEGRAAAPSHALSLWYRTPGEVAEKLTKTSNALPIGNGRLAAMVGGGVLSEQLQLNEESLWSGGPGGWEKDERNGDRPSTNVQGTQGSTYNFGYNEKKPDLPAIYEKLKNGATSGDAGTQGVDPEALQGNYIGFGNYKNFGFLHLEYQLPGKVIHDYRRELDLEDGLARVCFETNGVRFTREYAASYPANTIAVHIAADQPGQVHLTVSVAPGQPEVESTVQVDGHTITLSGALQDNGLRYAGVFRVVNEGGSMATGAQDIFVANADAVTIYFTAATDYHNEYVLPEGSELFEKLTYRTGESLEEIIARASDTLEQATQKSCGEFLAEHKNDYQALFGRVSLDIGGVNELPMDEALKRYQKAKKADEHSRALETLLYQYGRYLLIASSREGSLPANLQGKWNPDNYPPWSADYHTNINLQMNYWPAGGGNLLETMEPLEKFVRSLMVTGRYTAQRYCLPANTLEDAWKIEGAGWSTGNSGNIFGLTAPGTWWGWAWAPTSNAFLCQNLYQYLQYGGDLETFQRDYWPIIREAAVMWTKALVMPKDGLWKGKYVVCPSFSPEHGPLSVANAYDQQLVWELFTFTLDCIKRFDMEESDRALKENIEEKLANLYSPVNIGKYGIMEWSESQTEFDEYDREHRHMSQMVGFYPGTSIANGDPARFQAAVDTLNWRGDGATGWSMGWKINLWARALDGNRAYKLIQNLFKENLAQNMFGLHEMWGGYPPDGYAFQIDANFGYTAGVQEMLLQSHLSSIDLLPALPDAWPEGSVRGLRAIGGHEVAMRWSEGKLTYFSLKAFADGEIKVRNPALPDGEMTITAERGKIFSCEL